MTHRDLDVRHRVEEEDNFIFQQPDDEPEDMAEMTDDDWENEFWEEEDSINGD